MHALQLLLLLATSALSSSIDTHHLSKRVYTYRTNLATHKTDAFTPAEDSQLIHLHDSLPDRAMWQEASVVMNRRAKDLRDRYHKIISPVEPPIVHKNGRWSAEEDRMIKQEVERSQQERTPINFESLVTVFNRPERTIASHYFNKLSKPITAYKRKRLEMLTNTAEDTDAAGGSFDETIGKRQKPAKERVVTKKYSKRKIWTAEDDAVVYQEADRSKLEGRVINFASLGIALDRSTSSVVSHYFNKLNKSAAIIERNKRLDEQKEQDGLAKKRPRIVKPQSTPIESHVFKTGPWTEYEDATIIRHKDDIDARHVLHKLSAELDREPRQIRLHYRRHLATDLVSQIYGNWTDAENRFILDFAADAYRNGRTPSWTDLSAELGRPRTTVYSHFRLIFNKITRGNSGVGRTYRDNNESGMSASASHSSLESLNEEVLNDFLLGCDDFGCEETKDRIDFATVFHADMSDDEDALELVDVEDTDSDADDNEFKQLLVDIY